MLPASLKNSSNIKNAKMILDADTEYNTPGVLKQTIDVFWDLRYSKPIDDCISYLDIKAYVDLMNIAIEPREVKLIMQLDTTFRTQYFKEQSE